MLASRPPRLAALLTALALATLGASATSALARGGAPSPGKGPVVASSTSNLRAAKIPEIPTTISVPLSATRHLVVSIPGRLFHQCPRSSTTPTTFVGDGTILQNVWNETTGNSHGMAYIGSFPVPADPTSPFLDRAQQAVQSFVAGLGDRYSRLELVRLVTDASAITLTKTTVKMDGKPVACWRTSRFQTTLSGSGMSNKASAPLGSEALLLPDAMSSSVCYLLVDSKGRLSLDQLLDGLSFRSSADVNPKGRIVPLNDISYGLDGRFPIRLGWYTSPPGFLSTLASARASGELVYAEDRLDAAGAVTGSHRIEHRDRAAVADLGQQAEMERSLRGVPASAEPRSVDLAPGSGRALVLSWKTLASDRPAANRVAVFELDDKIWSFQWTTFGDDALVKADDVAFDALLGSMNLAIR